MLLTSFLQKKISIFVEKQSLFLSAKPKIQHFFKNLFKI